MHPGSLDPQYGSLGYAGFADWPTWRAGTPWPLAYAQREGKDPARRQTRLDFAGWLHSTGHTGDLWPPERNSPC